MGVQRFRTFEEARRALWLPAGDPRILERMMRLAELATHRGPCPRGVFRFRSIEEAKRGRHHATMGEAKRGRPVATVER